MENFNKILGKEVQKKTELLSLLYNQPTIITTNELSKKLKMDRRSIYKYFDLLSELPYVQENNGILVEKHGQGYKFNGTKKDYKILSTQIIQETPFFKLIENILTNTQVNIVQFAYDNFLSESMVNKKLSLLRKHLNTMELDLKKRQGIVRLVGDEEKIRFLIVAFFWRNYNGIDWPFAGISKTNCKKIISTIYTQNGIEVPPAKMELSCYILATSILRSKKGGTIINQHLNTLTKTLFLSDNFFIKIKHFNRSMYKHLSPKYHLKREDIEYLTILAFREPFFLMQIFKDVNTISEVFNNKNLLELLLCSDDIERNFTYSNFQTKKIFISSIIAAFVSAETIGKVDYTISGYNINKYIHKNYPTVKPIINAILDENNVYSEDSNKRSSLITPLASSYALLISPSKNQKLIKIKIETDLSQSLETLIIERISDAFKSFYHLELNSSIPESEAAFCLCTNYRSLDFINIDTVLIDAQVSFKDFINIQNKIKSILSKHN
ncbi:helix-turn-helix domain-containing protein [Enterococcus faecium]|uniref:helix-turn-helix domain-containing protein n=1 Tax=Enterococcus faecium TaxID=1352 RepID=UPI00187C7645|nr:helix-turn-helix domain-containing protein [Enterococcus faecium]